MKLYIGIDDTDVLDSAIGTGKLVRMFDSKLPDGVRPIGVLRHQLLVDPRIPYTSHNSPAVSVVDLEDAALIPRVIDAAIAHLDELCSLGSDPGLCVARDDTDLSALVAFGLSCTREIRSQSEAMEAAHAVHLSGHGGTNDGIIGAAAGVGLTAYGWSGRFIEYGGLRGLPNPVTVGQLRTQGIRTVTLDHDATVLSDDIEIDTNDWVSPRSWGGIPSLPVAYENGKWVSPAKRSRDADVAE